MHRTFRWTGLVAGIALVGGAFRAGAQQVVVFGSAEAGGLGSSLFLRGGSVSGKGLGWQPVANVEGYHLTFRSGPGKTTTNDVLAPSAGLKYNVGEGAVQARVGYAFVSSSTGTPATVGVFPIPSASKNGVLAAFQGDYWGTGAQTAQLIGSYNFANEFLWSRVRAAQRIGAADSPLMLGAEAGFLGTNKTSGNWGWFVGPTIGYRVMPELRLTAAGGYRTSTASDRK